MNNLKSNQVWRVIFSISVIVLVLMLGANAIAKEPGPIPVIGPIPVTVENDETTPIPVVIEQPSDTPQPVTVTSGEIIVANDGLAPIPVYDLSSITDYGEHIQFMLNIALEDGEQSGYAGFDVPEGFRFFVDYVTVDARLYYGQKCMLQITMHSADYNTGYGVQHKFALTPIGESISTAISFENHFLSEATDIFVDADPGYAYPELSVILGRGSFNNEGIGSATVTMKGRLVPLD